VGVTPSDVYLDTCVTIDLIDGVYGPSNPSVGGYSRLLEVNACISHLVRMECRVRALKMQKTAQLERIEAFLAGIQLLELTPEVFDLAAGLRAKHGIKAIDALHLACALHHGCREFWTDDDRLAKAAGRGLSVKVFRPSTA
jgi:predicted nucleic acid-binding protein